jgi:hypothetical protein
VEAVVGRQLAEEYRPTVRPPRLEHSKRFVREPAYLRAVYVDYVRMGSSGDISSRVNAILSPSADQAGDKPQRRGLVSGLSSVPSAFER